MNLHDLSIEDLKVMHGRLLTKACRVWAEIQKLECGESIESKINRLRGKQRDFLLALFKAPKKRMRVFELEKKVWGDKWVEHETSRKLIQRLESSIERNCIPLFIESVCNKNGEVVGYKIKKKK